VPSADVVVVGAGLAGLSAAIGLADRGARVVAVAAGHTATHWAAGPLDVAAPPGAAMTSAGLAALAAVRGHPYAALGDAVAPAVARFAELAAGGGLPYRGTTGDPLRDLPTSLGATRPVAIVPDAMADVLAPWAPGERLVVVSPAGFKDLWAVEVAAALSRPDAWSADRPARIDGVTVELPGLSGRRNLNALVLAGLFDDPGWRSAALDAIARAVDAAGSGPARVALPAALGLADHPAALAAARERLGRRVFELPLVPPSVPGLRLYAVLRAALRARGGRLLEGEPAIRFESDRDRVTAIATSAAVREVVIHCGAVVLATGGIAGGGIVGEPSGELRETVLGLAVEGPPIDEWLAGDPLDPATMPIAPAGIRTDVDLRPTAPRYENVRVVGSLLAGQRYLLERCGDGVALASAWRAATSLTSGGGRAARSARPEERSKRRKNRVAR
jgi:glycerol-3-phosphate dehydrogenase subunit B